jgi:hypothetical protein
MVHPSGQVKDMQYIYRCTQATWSTPRTSYSDGLDSLPEREVCQEDLSRVCRQNSALSAMIMPYVEHLLQNKLALHPATVTLQAGLNQPNISYTSLDIVATVSNFQNLDFLVPNSYHPLVLVQKTKFFFETQNMSCNASRYINSEFPKIYQDLNISRHYHSGMSAEYLEETYNSFF